MPKDIPQVIIVPEENDQEYPATLLDSLRYAPQDCIIAYQDPTRGNNIYILQTYHTTNVWVNAMDPTDYIVADFTFIVQAITNIIQGPDDIEVLRFKTLKGCLDYFISATEESQILQADYDESMVSLHKEIQATITNVLNRAMQVNGMHQHMNEVAEELSEAVTILWDQYGLDSNEKDSSNETEKD